MTDRNKKDVKKIQSFLHEAQKFGKAEGVVKMDDLDQAIQDINRITIPEAAKMLKDDDSDVIPRKKLCIYCHDCRAIVSVGIKMVRRKHRKVCGVCSSVKISAGSQDALERFYHLEDKQPST